MIYDIFKAWSVYFCTNQFKSKTNNQLFQWNPYKSKEEERESDDERIHFEESLDPAEDRALQ